MIFGRKYRKLWLKLFSILAIFVSLFVYTNLKAEVTEHEAQVSVLTDEELLPVFVNDIGNAKKSIYMAIYMFKTSDFKPGDTEIIKQALLKAARSGVKVYVMMDDSDKKDITGKINRETGEELSKGGIKVVYDAKSKRMHSKVTVIDGRITYIGSHNYTVSAMKYNNEITARIVSDGAAAETAEYIKSIKEGRP
ncbi:phospholipase D-like protein [Seleniivibrio woodruffii]|uniref:phospholipase D n=1 Tax=Seleniivibrio woodruffii TaxID=1078050 RepID=A0A4R1K6E3_9BACT|nr:phospholipase D-like protein [Seleniivibrio woodruffii]TVZ35402.1 phospholipase D-like protein [Seleniivibrio woodruffii]